MLDYVGPCLSHGFLALVRTKDVQTDAVVVVQVSSDALRDKFGWAGDLGEGAGANLSDIMSAANQKYASEKTSPLLLTSADF